MDDTAGAAGRRAITVTGEGRVLAPADAARVELGAEATAGTPAEALAACADTERAMTQAVGSAGIANAKITTGWATVEAEWEHVGDRPRLRGYTARVVVRADVADLATAGRVASAALEAGGHGARLHGLVPRISDTERAEHAAREAAFGAARAKAQQFATLAGARLGRVLALSDARHGWQPAHGPMRASAMSFSAGEPLDVHAGEHQVAVEVTATWELVD